MIIIAEKIAVIAIMLIILCVLVLGFIKFYVNGKKAHLDSLKAWLLYATTEAERVFGSKTGKIKLRFVYDAFIEKFPMLSNFLTFSRFSELVDSALVDMRKMLDTNTAVNDYVNGKE